MDEKEGDRNHKSDLHEKRAVSESVEEMSIIDQDKSVARFSKTSYAFFCSVRSLPKKADNGSDSEEGDSKKSKSRAAGPLEIVSYAVLRT